MNGIGFYKNDNTVLLFAPNFVDAPTFELNIELKDTYDYPVNGWHVFDSEKLARDFFNLPLENIEDE